MRQAECFLSLGHFLPFQPPDNPENQNFKIEKSIWRYNFTHVHHKSQSYDVWVLRNGASQTELFVILDHFWHIYPPTDPENQNFGTMNNTPKDIILQMFTINYSHMMYNSWDMKCNTHNFLSFWTIFYPFSPLTTQKISILKNWKKYPEILSFYTWVPKMTIKWRMVPEILSVTDKFFCHFGPFFALLPP